MEGRAEKARVEKKRRELERRERAEREEEERRMKRERNVIWRGIERADQEERKYIVEGITKRELGRKLRMKWIEERRREDGTWMILTEMEKIEDREEVLGKEGKIRGEWEWEWMRI